LRGRGTQLSAAPRDCWEAVNGGLRMAGWLLEMGGAARRLREQLRVARLAMAHLPRASPSAVLRPSCKDCALSRCKIEGLSHAWRAPGRNQPLI
jgi:hypothetical protein